jgi:hypothetical protein
MSAAVTALRASVIAASRSEAVRGSFPLTNALTFDQQSSNGEKSGE